MRTQIHPALAQRPDIQRADAILRRCVHCGFCNATCPTYQVQREELDGPRGRIYLIKNLLEQNDMAPEAVTHLDRCLTCRACETTCPSGVQYGELVDIGRDMANRHAERPIFRRVLATGLRLVVPRRWLFAPLLRLGQWLRPVLPGVLRSHVPPAAPVRHSPPAARPAGPRVLLLTGCVQSVATPNVVAALQHLLGQAGIRADVIDEGCCGALEYHLSAHEAGKARMKQVIERVEPHLDQVDAIISTATGCGVTLTEYERIFQDDPAWVARAARVASSIQDAVTYLGDTLLAENVGGNLPAMRKTGQVIQGQRVAVHTPCSMQHGMQLNGRVEQILERLGFELVPHQEGHICCGSAGSYSILEPQIASELRGRKLEHLQAGEPDVIVTANIGCQLHLGSEARVPVMHWLELVADQINPASS